MPTPLLNKLIKSGCVIKSTSAKQPLPISRRAPFDLRLYLGCAADDLIYMVKTQSLCRTVVGLENLERFGEAMSMAPLQSFRASSTCFDAEPHNRGYSHVDRDSSGILSAPNRRFHGPSSIIYRALPAQGHMFSRRRSMCVVADEAAAYESWRDTKSAKRILTVAGRTTLNHYLNKIVRVVPRTPSQNVMACHEFPILNVSPAEVWPLFPFLSFFSLGWCFSDLCFSQSLMAMDAYSYFAISSHPSSQAAGTTTRPCFQRNKLS